MVIDFHTHCFPAKIAARALQNVAHNAGDIPALHAGSTDDLRREIHRQGADMAVVLHIATNPQQQTNVNDFALETDRYADLVAFGSVHPGSEQALYELDRLHAAGIKGIKLHPDYQGFAVDDPLVQPIYRRIAHHGMITVFHAGCDIGLPEPVHCTPQQLKAILPLFEGAPVVAAHMGGYLLWRDALKHLSGQDIYMDTSYSHTHMPPLWAQELIDRHGADRFLFGSDMPWGATHGNMAFIRSLGLPEDACTAILGKNAMRLLGLN